MRYFLEKERIGLKKLDRSEVTQEYVDWLNDSAVTRTLVSGKLPTGIEDIEAFVASANKPGTITFAIYYKESQKHIGNVKLDHIDWISRRAEFGIMLGDRDSWGKGYGYEATKLVIDYAFQTLNLNRIILGVQERNLSAKHIYEKLGFVVEGLRTQEQYVQGEYENCYVMGLTRNRWLAANLRIVAIIQARMTSSRLKGKVLLPLVDKPMLAHIVDRTRAAKRVTATVVATSTDPSDDPIEAMCRSYNIPCYRGNLNDVLERYAGAAKEHSADVIVRITGDCPLIDPAIVDAVIDRYLENIEHVDYVSNMDVPTFPDGLDTEVFSMRALKRALTDAKLPSEREHVTLYMRKHMRKINLPIEGKQYGHLRWSVDYEEDYYVVKQLYENLYREGEIFGYKEIIDYLKLRPELTTLNAHIQINEGLEKSLEADPGG